MYFIERQQQILKKYAFWNAYLYSAMLKKERQAEREKIFSSLGLVFSKVEIENATLSWVVHEFKSANQKL